MEKALIVLAPIFRWGICGKRHCPFWVVGGHGDNPHLQRIFLCVVLAEPQEMPLRGEHLLQPAPMMVRILMIQEAIQGPQRCLRESGLILSDI